ncbi:hypothetical protein KAR91_42830 [Candidatus Pacearchaeota archaeon]|nr:hypothetical protein [Candidatus Pacearchaeota archaeon]
MIKYKLDDYDRELRLWLDNYLKSDPRTQMEISITIGIDPPSYNNPRNLQLLKSFTQTSPWKLEDILKFSNYFNMSPGKFLTEIEKGNNFKK